MECPATLKQSFDELKNPGDFLYSRAYSGKENDRPSSIVFVCPCGICGDISSVRIRNKENEAEHPAWLWNDNREKPTLTPSILRLDSCKWHGYLTDGVFKSC